MNHVTLSPTNALGWRFGSGNSCSTLGANHGASESARSEGRPDVL